MFTVVISRSPNIILILADDLGWNEVSWNNPSFLTPNLEVPLELSHQRSEMLIVEIFPCRSPPHPVLHHSQVLPQPGCPDDWEISLEDWDAARSDREVPARRSEYFHPNITSVSPAGGILHSRGNLVFHIFTGKHSTIYLL